MSQPLATIDGTAVPAAPAPLGGRFANPLAQARGLMGQPAFRRALPMILMVGLVAAAALAWMLVQTPPQRVLFTQLADQDKASVSEALATAQIDSAFDQSGAITVAEEDYHRARMLLASQDLPRAAPGGYAILDELPMGVSRAVEGERLRQARETELARSIEEIDSVADARVHLAMPESSVFVRDRAEPSASVIVRLEPGRTLSDAQVRSIVNLTASSVPGMKPDHVTIVDQMGALLSNPDRDALGDAGNARIDFQRRIEDKYRAQLTTLLTPLVGPNNFSAEIQAEVDLDESQATRERYDKEGVIRAEQGNWTGATGQPAIPGGIPGALSNTAPAPATLANPALAQGVDPNAAPAVPGAVPAPGGVLPKASEEFARAYDLGKEISVTRAAPGDIKRLSVAVLLRDPEGGKPRSAAEIKQISDLVKAAVGFNAQRQDQVTVISRAFSPSAVDGDAAAWYDASWVPMVARNGTALVIALLVLLLGVRPLAKAVLKKREEGGSPDRAALAGPEGPTGAHATERSTPGEEAVSIERLEGARDYDERVGLVRGFTRDNPARAALAVRDMIRAEAP